MKIVFMGTPEAAVPSLERIVADGHDVIEVWTQPDRRAGRGQKLTPPPVKVCASGLGISLFQPDKIKTIAARKRFVETRADVAVVVAYGRILTKTYLESFPMGCINVHFSLLPKYRGAAPVNWAIANGEAVTGVTTMKMDSGLDTGDILLSRETKIKPSENAIDLMARLSFIGAELLSDTMFGFADIEPKSQDEESASLAPLFKKADGEIDWRKSAFVIANRIRGFQPFPKSFSKIGAQNVIFWKAEESSQLAESLPGKVIKASEGELLIGCGQNTVLKVNELQAAGRPRMKIDVFLNGDRLKPGDLFGNE